jgi:hypothetical protein
LFLFCAFFRSWTSSATSLTACPSPPITSGTTTLCSKSSGNT